MRKKKIRKVIQKFKYLKEERKNTLLNFRNNLLVKGCYLTLRWIYPSPPMGRKPLECLAVPARYKEKFVIGDVVLFDQKAKLRLKIFKNIALGQKDQHYFKITEINQQEVWDGLSGPYTLIFLDIKDLNNLEFLSAMNEMKKRKKKRDKK